MAQTFTVRSRFESLGADAAESYPTRHEAECEAVVLREAIQAMVATMPIPDDEGVSDTGYESECEAWAHAETLATVPGVYGLNAGEYIAELAVEIVEEPDVRPAREYSLDLRDDAQGSAQMSFTAAAGTEAEQDAAATEWAQQEAEDWPTGGEWGDEGARVVVWATLTDDEADGDGIWSDRLEVTIEPDHDALIRAAGGDPECDHEWTSEDEGRCDENPGVWATSGTSMTFRAHCRTCGLVRTEHHTGSQRNPGETDTVEYSLPDAS